MSKKERDVLRVYLDVQIGRRTGGRIVFELFTDVTPVTAENFRQLCTGEKGKSAFSRKPLTYAMSKIHRIESKVAFTAGDFISNNGKSMGESIHGREGFRAEQCVRKHSQAGVLSMVKDKSHMCHSLFHVTFTRIRHYDALCVVFGQVVAGMEIVRAIEQVPCEGDCVPRVDVVITGSGQLTNQEFRALVAEKGHIANAAQAGEDLIHNPSLTMISMPSDSGPQIIGGVEATALGVEGEGLKGIEEGDEDEESDSNEIKITTVQSSVSNMAGKVKATMDEKIDQTKDQSSSKMLASNLADDDSSSDDSDGKIIIKSKTSSGFGASSISSSKGPIPGTGAASSSSGPSLKQQRLAELKLKMNQGRQQNTAAVLEEKKRADVGPLQYYKRQQEASDKAARQAKQEEIEEQVVEGLLDPSVMNVAEKLALPKEKRYLAEGIEISQARENKKRRKMNAEQLASYNVFNQDALYRAQDKRNADINFDKDAYDKQKKELGDETFYNREGRSQGVVTGFEPTANAKARFMDALKKRDEKNDNFQRRRIHVDDKDIQHINDRNAVFNKKMDRYYGDHTLETRQNLERGTAL